MTTRVGVVATGRFGRDVGDIIEGWEGFRAVRTAPGERGLDALGGGPHGPGVEAVLAVFWRPADRECERIDAWSFRTGTPWLPVVLEFPALVVGPWIEPPAGPCHRCVAGRRAQHDGHVRNSRELRAAYDEDPELGPVGHLPQHARLAAGLALRTLRQQGRTADGRRRPSAAAVTTASLPTGRIRVDEVMGCTGCARCAPAGLAERSARTLESALSACGPIASARGAGSTAVRG